MTADDCPPGSPRSPRPPRPAREPQLDGLRCLAFLAVYGVHAKEAWFPWGWGGVQVFFALSGFLITRILIRGESGDLRADLGRFYLRRSLRIFPLYYLVLALIWWSGRLPDPAWLLTYTYNLRVFMTSAIDHVVGHFWTLCVEEQFYILFPLILLATPARHRLALVLGLVAGSLAFQVYSHRHFNVGAARSLLPYAGEHLLVGAAAGLIDLRLGPTPRLGTVAFVLGCALLVLGWNLYEHRLPLDGVVQGVASVSAYAVGSTLVVFGLSRTSSRWVLGPLSLPPITYLGRISYGLYAFHIPVLLVWLHDVPFAFLLPHFWGGLLATIGLAALSWHWFEAPLNRLKDRWSPPTLAEPSTEPPATAAGARGESRSSR